MKKNTAERLTNSLPDLIKNVSDYLKTLFSSSNIKDNVSNATGSIGFLIKLLGKPIVDKYFEKKGRDKLKDFGFFSYVAAAFSQSERSLEKLKDEEIFAEFDLIAISDGLQNKLYDRIDGLEKRNTLLVFQPKYHPGVTIVKELIIQALIDLKADDNLIKSFQKDFNDNIELSVQDVFGEEYNKHKKNVEKFWYSTNETELLLDCIKEDRIGFSDNEKLSYVDAFGSWIPVSSYATFSETHNRNDELEKHEKGLKKIETLVDEYFSVDPENQLEKILFIVADFGKGKSVFLRHFASNLAKNYLEKGEGDFPIYFNLRNFGNYSSETQYGIIEDYLETRYGIKISSEHFKSKRFFFLIDSLDESCDLSKSAIEKVVNSVKRIQNIDKSSYRENKIIITSRPLGHALYQIINLNKPHYLKNQQGKDVGHFISVYGFKKEQFNNWIYNALVSIRNEIKTESAEGIIKEIVFKLDGQGVLDIYSQLRNNSLSEGELRRPIFAYMIYQLIKNNINITKVGKISIYLSFLNLLSKDAKYIHDPNYKISLLEQFEARNILHLISVLWIYEKQFGAQGFLKKADICRIIEGKDTIENDEEIIERFKGRGVNEIQFLSHSYFGEKDNILHFQHQSFAEILLAEYYIKVILKYSLDRYSKIEEVIAKLKIGNPTNQTMEFFSEILSLLKETVSNEVSEEIIDKRKLLFPLISSISIVKNNQNLFSDQLYYNWFSKAKIDFETSDIPEVLLKNWCVTNDVVEKMISLCKQIVEYNKTIVLSKSFTLTALYNNEITHLNNAEYLSTIDLEKCIALLAAKKLAKDNESYILKNLDPSYVINLLKRNEFAWARSLFSGLTILQNDLADREQIFGNIEAYNYDFTNSRFNNVILFNSEFVNCNFSNSNFENISFLNCIIESCNFDNVNITGLFDISTSKISEIMLAPFTLTKKVINKSFKPEFKNSIVFMVPFKNEKNLIYNIPKIINEQGINQVFHSLSFYFRYGIESNYFSKSDISKAFSYKNKEIKAKFLQLLNDL